MLKTRVGDIPKWLENQINSPYPINGNGRYPASSIAKHLIEIGYKVNVSNLFKVVYKIKKGRMLRFAEALAIRRLNPPPPVVPKSSLFSH